MKKIIVSVLALFMFTCSVSALEYSDEYTETFQKITTDGIFRIKAVEPSDTIEADYMITSYVKKLIDDSSYDVDVVCDDDLAACDIILVPNGGAAEVHKVEMAYVATDEAIKAKVDEVVSKIDKSNYLVTDLASLDYWKNIKGTYTPGVGNVQYLPNHSDEIMAAVGDSGVTVEFEARAGGGTPFSFGNEGGLVFYYGDIVYAAKTAGMGVDKVIYVPADTPDSSEAYINAAMKRIDEEFGENHNISIKSAGALTGSEVEDSYDFIVPVAQRRDEYYLVEIGKMGYSYLIAREAEEASYEVKDEETKIEVSTDSSEVPADTKIIVEEINKDNEKFKEIAKELNTDNIAVYDISLYSEAAKQYITKISDGVFKVRIPIPENLKGLDMGVFYIGDEVVEIPATIEGDYVEFLTDHFSIYTLAEKQASIGVAPDMMPPKTGDNVITYAVLSIISIIGIATAAMYLKKENLGN